MAKKSKMTNFIVKGISAVCAFLASMMLICPLYLNKVGSANLFDCLDHTEELFDLYGTSYAMMTIVFAIVFFVGLIMAVMFILNMFLNNKLIDKILVIVGVAFALLAVAGLICTFVFCGTDIAKLANWGVGVGAILATIFAVASCAMTFAEKSLCK